MSVCDNLRRVVEAEITLGHHASGDEIGTIPFAIVAAHLQIRGQRTPQLTIPVDTGTAQPRNRQKRAQPTHRQGALLSVVAKGQGFLAQVHHMFVA